jgi:hypothetical protein
MPNPLDPIWDAHLTARAALKVVKRCVTVAAIDSRKAFSNTRFEGLTEQQCIESIDAAQTEVDDSAVLSLLRHFFRLRGLRDFQDVHQQSHRIARRRAGFCNGENSHGVLSAPGRRVDVDYLETDHERHCSLRTARYPI